MKKQLLTLFAIVTVAEVVLLAVNVKHAPEPVVQAPAVTAPVVTHPVVSEIATLVNQERLKAGLPALQLDGRLYASAEAKCKTMQDLDIWAHDLPDGRTPLSFMQVQIPQIHLWAENLTWGWNNSPLVVSKWMNSPGHKANILNPAYTNVGYATCSAKDYPDMVVQHFEG